MATAVKDLYSRLASIYTSISPPTLPKRTDTPPLRLGILGAANIAPLAVIAPARTHPDIIVSAIAARSKSKATAFAKKHSIPHVFSTYDELINDPSIDVVYNPLPNGLHYEWTMKCIAARKHVLLEKPSTSNEADTKRMFDAAAEANVLVLEAFHYRFHPALHEFAFRLHDFMSPQNPMMAVEACLFAPTGVIGEGDIRFDYTLAGGATMDMGCYPTSAVLYTMRAAAGSWQRANWEDGIEVREARPTVFEPRNKTSKGHLNSQGDSGIDVAMESTILVPTARPAKLPCKIEASLARSLFTLPVVGWRVPNMTRLTPTLKATFKDGSTVELQNFVMPVLWHSIKVTYRGKSAAAANLPEGTVKTYKAYVPGDSAGTDQMRRAAKDGHWPKGTGEVWWSTYRWQLEAFVLGVEAVQAGTKASEVSPINMINEDRDRSSKRVPVWMQNEESIIVMKTIDAIYERSGLGKRVSPSS
ncbi:Oxidoreductase, N-terminal [Kalmanozyma brasiliensis GHG001]|uniref:D-xylose 1-dehydrogenase (NADP(+), D-xylono-1,5-lactone-forming) n=1 Tax=Kalmanozyma brasiliensis (strain GHG001) TaxID=1365824 RepID=V5EBW7_KALBG|nr:Oxidoreductase, N-terminal [Kalmanozyma brasiliensis GHG001]EST07931.1 Oxidoreductase, N-terminal [Kalmanozyma brasiliensis GHG001]